MKIALLSLILILPLAAAVPIQGVDLQHAASILTGTTILTGGLTAVVEPPDPNRLATNHPPSWNLTAKHIHAERDESVAPATGPVSVQRHTTTRVEDYPRATATGEARGTYSLGILPLPDSAAPILTAVTACLHIDADAAGDVEADRGQRSPDRPTPAADVGNALHVAACPGSSWTLNVEGSFLLVLWEWHTTITTQDGKTEDWSSGKDPTTAPGTETLRQSFLTVQNGVFQYHGTSSTTPQLFLAHLTAHVLGDVRFHDARTPDARGDLTVSGALNLTTHRTGDHASTRLTGDVESATLNDHAITLATTTTQPATQAPWLIPAALGLVAVSAAMASTAHRLRLRRDLAVLGGHSANRAQAAYHHAHHLTKGGHHDRAARFARLATRLDRLNALAWELLGDCHQDQGHHHRALRAYTRTYRLLHDDHAPHTTQAAVAYLVARLHAQRDDHAKALAWLHRAAHHRPGILEDAQVEPDFDHLRDDPEFQGLRPDNPAV